MEEQLIPGDGVVCGHGQVDGRQVYAFAQDFTVVRRIAVGDQRGQNRQDHGPGDEDGRPGRRVKTLAAPASREGVVSLGGYADIFLRNVLSSGVVPQISASWPVRRRGRLFTGHHRLHHHGPEDELHVSSPDRTS